MTSDWTRVTEQLRRRAPDLRTFRCDLAPARTFREACDARGWEAIETDISAFRVDEDLVLSYFAPSDPGSPPLTMLRVGLDAETTRAELDRRYHEAKLVLKEAWGRPRRERKHRYEQTFSHAMWEGKGGLLVLAQDDPDAQLGFQIVLWLYPWQRGEPWPMFPLL